MYALLFLAIVTRSAIAQSTGAGNGKPQLVVQLGHTSITGGINCADFSADGKFLVTGSQDGTAVIWDVTSRREIRTLRHKDFVTSVAWSPDSKYILTGCADTYVHLWEAATGREIRAFLAGPSISSIVLSSDGRDALVMKKVGAPVLFALSSGSVKRTFSDALSAAISSNGTIIVTTSGSGSLQVSERDTGRVLSRIKNSRVGGELVVSADGKFAVTDSPGNTVTVWNLGTGSEYQRLVGHSDQITGIVISRDGRRVITSSIDKSVRLWDVESGRQLRKFDGDDPIACSPDGRYGLYQTIGAVELTLFDLSNGETVGKSASTGSGVFDRETDPVEQVGYSPDGKLLLTLIDTRGLRAWDVQTGRESGSTQTLPRRPGFTASTADRRYEVVYNDLIDVATGKVLTKFDSNHDVVRSVAISADGRLVLTGSIDSTVELWDAKTGKRLHQLEGHVGVVNFVEFSPDGRTVVTAGQDCTTRIWDVISGKELVRLISLRNGNWVAVDPDGRFDASDLEAIRGLQWVMPDDPMRPLPIEIFMRDYYEPRLLPRILAGEKFKDVRKLSNLNRIQPSVTIASVEPQREDPNRATVTVKVAGAKSESQRDKAGNLLETGVYDIRLFRDGQIVGEKPVQDEIPMSLEMSYEEQLNGWRSTRRVRLDAEGKATLVFKDIRIPRRAGLGKVEFSAYAFNEDRVKSETDRRSFPTPPGAASSPGNAYILAIGVNAYQNASWNLRFAADDARLAGKSLAEKLKATGQYGEVIELPLISDYHGLEGEKPATKANIRAALAELAKRVRPEDVLIIYYSSHGYADGSGRYYFFTTDTGAGTARKIDIALLGRIISSDELSGWLRAIDASDMVMIVDACQSAGTVQGEGGEEFKPGPMGSRGLGQLAYDKRMRILAASQKDDFALESGQLKQGLLTYALVKDGIEARKADNNRDGQITLDEWLGYGVERVPVLLGAVRNHSLKELFKAEGGKGPVVVGSGDSLKSRHGLQQPALFDFAMKTRDVMLEGTRRTGTQIISNRTALAVAIGAPGFLPHSRLQLGDPQEVGAVTFSTNGKYMLTGSDQGTIRLWEVETGREMRRFDGHTGAINSVAFSHDGKYMLSASEDATARLWKIETGAEVRRFAGITDEVLSAAVSPDGQYVMIADGYARLFRVETGSEERRFEAYNSTVTSVAFSPDGKHVLLGSTDSDLGEIATAELWDVKSGRQLLQLKGFSAAGPDSISVAFSPDGKYLLTGSNDGAARLWESSTGRELRRFQAGSVNSIAFSPDGLYVLIAGDSKSVLCATGSENPVYRFPPARAVAFSPDGKYWLVGTQLWTVAPGR